MASGTPVIALDGPGQRDIILDGINGFLVTNKEEMVEKINSISANPSLFGQLQHHAHITAQQFLPESIINQLCCFYQNTLEKIPIH